MGKRPAVKRGMSHMNYSPAMENPMPSWVPQEHTKAEKEAKVRLVKMLAEDLGNPMKANFGATLEAIVLHASALLRDEAIRTGRGYKYPTGAK